MKVFQLISQTFYDASIRNSEHSLKYFYTPQNSYLVSSHICEMQIFAFLKSSALLEQQSKAKKLKSDEFIEERLRAISIMLIYFIVSPFRCHFAVEIGRARSRVANSNIDDPFRAFNRS